MTICTSPLADAAKDYWQRSRYMQGLATNKDRENYAVLVLYPLSQDPMTPPERRTLFYRLASRVQIAA